MLISSPFRRILYSGLKPRAFRHQELHTHSRLQQRYQYNHGRFQQSKNIFKQWASRPTFYYEVGLISLAVGGFYTYNLETVPVSGRRRFNIISAEQEASISQRQYGIIMSQFRGQILPEGDKRTKQVRRVMERLIPNSGLEGLHWEVHVIQNEDLNAFVIPGGKVFVFTGILPICQDDEGIAAVLGHEIAHTVAHHAAERMSRASIITLATFIVSGLLGLPDLGSQLLLSLAFDRPNGRLQESEADYIGLMMMAQSCFSPAAAADFWRRMIRNEKTNPPEFLSTHPSSTHRLENMQKWLPEAESMRAESGCGAVLEHADDFRKLLFQERW